MYTLYHIIGFTVDDLEEYNVSYVLIINTEQRYKIKNKCSDVIILTFTINVMKYK